MDPVTAALTLATEVGDMDRSDQPESLMDAPRRRSNWKQASEARAQRAPEKCPHCDTVDPPEWVTRGWLCPCCARVFPACGSLRLKAKSALGF